MLWTFKAKEKESDFKSFVLSFTLFVFLPVSLLETSSPRIACHLHLTYNNCLFIPTLLLTSEHSDLCCFSSTNPSEFITLGVVPCTFLDCFMAVCHCLENNTQGKSWYTDRFPPSICESKRLCLKEQVHCSL